MEKNTHEIAGMCAGCGAFVPATESLCPSCTQRLHDGLVAWVDKSHEEEVYENNSKNAH